MHMWTLYNATTTNNLINLINFIIIRSSSSHLKDNTTTSFINSSINHPLATLYYFIYIIYNHTHSLKIIKGHWVLKNSLKITFLEVWTLARSCQQNCKIFQNLTHRGARSCYLGTRPCQTLRHRNSDFSFSVSRKNPVLISQPKISTPKLVYSQINIQVTQDS